jgi:hypothetical protein
MTVLTGLLILAAVLVAAALAVLGAIAAATEIFPPWFGRSDEKSVSASVSSLRPDLLRGGRSEATHTRA